MRRTVPLLITALAGSVLVASRFVPKAESWGEVATVWFNILAAIAFVLGGGTLVKMNLKKISDRASGWGYAAIALLSFLVMLFVGLAKIGVPPSPDQEFFGQTFAPLAVSDLPDSTVTRLAGSIPTRGDGEEPPLSVTRQLGEQAGQVVFRGWMTSQQKIELADYKETLAWKCLVDQLYEASQPQPPLAGKVEYRADHGALSFAGVMSDAARDALLKLNGNARWNEAVESLYRRSRRESAVAVTTPPAGFRVPESMKDVVTYDAAKGTLGLRGPMAMAQRDRLARDGFPLARPSTAQERTRFRDALESQGGRLNQEQAKVLIGLMQSTWTIDQLRTVLDDAGRAVAEPPSACEREQSRVAANAVAKNAPQKSRPTDVPLNAAQHPDVPLNAAQRSALDAFAQSDSMTVDALADRLRAAGPFTDAQAAALRTFFSKVPTRAEQKLAFAVELMRAGPLTRAQRGDLVGEYREQVAWRQVVGRLFAGAHETKYPWSGRYNAPGCAFDWIYEFVLKPLMATIFALLAFYVASAAFRAFRAKNFEAILLLGTAFIVLLGQTFAGYWLTSWLPADPSNPLSLLRIENLKVFIMKVFNTAGTRAIMIGIALGLASTSLKVLLGIDRSYLGSGKD